MDLKTLRQEVVNPPRDVIETVSFIGGLATATELITRQPVSFFEALGLGAGIAYVANTVLRTFRYPKSDKDNK